MKKSIFYIGAGLVSALAFASCSDTFLEEKKNYDNVNTDIYNYTEGVNGRLNDLYSWCLPDANSGDNLRWKSPSAGTNDMMGKSTEEYSGFSVFVDPDNPLTSMSSTNAVPDFFMGDASNIQASVYGRIRNINDCIAGIRNGSLPQAEKDIYLGQCYFLRAWCYYNLFKWYGGVPLVAEVQDPVESAVTPRSSAKATFDFIMADIDHAAKLLAAKTMNGGWTGNDYGRVTTGTALALKGRLLQLWCSPLFNRADDRNRWASAYNIMKAGLDSINACGYGLYATANNVNGSDFAAMFTQDGRNPEAVFVTLYNKVTGDGLDNQKNNSWERWIRPKNATGSGFNASAMLIDLFPMADGKIPAGRNTYTKLEPSELTYDANAPFMDRDPRFYRTFAFPGFRWTYNGDAGIANAQYPSDGANYVLWNYCWYTSTDDQGNVESSNNYFADGLLNNGKAGVYVRKKSDDYDLNTSPLYTFAAAVGTSNGGFSYSGAQHMELRYAEVLLNLAEVACGAGHTDEAVQLLQQVRARAGYTAADNYGLQANLAADKAACMSAILYERQIEFAYEGKRFDDMRRWLLFDGGANFASISGAPSTWTLTGWGGNTCTWLGFKPMNGQRRENMEFRTADAFGVGGTTYDSDPLVKAGVARPAGVDLRKDLTDQLRTLQQWYHANLVCKTKKGDSYNSNKQEEYIRFNPNYYFLGLTNGASTANKALEQTIGWKSAANGGAEGTFDPLAQ